eukprot:CAMPEP_0194082384 /NCGR_PEP_ID=MMETSP0149-20130528/7914_1 /TAXON_ID=122233 /ORGANISM="Chaetoceros debilis, Strain MM31A-1" /LENGTH=80 /DNA_ID=CAMNT_0038764525 /DNA_START=138 /DNA_END=381 /DNA_ORIENTATION=+
MYDVAGDGDGDEKDEGKDKDKVENIDKAKNKNAGDDISFDDNGSARNPLFSTPAGSAKSKEDSRVSSDVQIVRAAGSVII